MEAGWLDLGKGCTFLCASCPCQCPLQQHGFFLAGAFAFRSQFYSLPGTSLVDCLETLVLAFVPAFRFHFLSFYYVESCEIAGIGTFWSKKRAIFYNSYQDRLHYLWSPVQNENEETLSKKLLRITRQWQQSIKLSMRLFWVGAAVWLLKSHTLKLWFKLIDSQKPDFSPSFPGPGGGGSLR